MNGPTTKIKVPKGVSSNAKLQYTYDNSFWSFDEFDTLEDGYLK